MVRGARSAVRGILRKGLVIPAHPLALTRNLKLDERRQRALTRYYLAAGAGGVAVGVHTTQFEIREHGMYRPVLELAAEEARGVVRVAGIVGRTPQAVREAGIARDLGYHAGLLSLGALRTATTAQLIAHVRAVAEVIPVFGFYLQPAVGGRVLPEEFWRRFCEIENVVAIKVAPFDRYRTLDVVRAVKASGRNDIALYTGNDDNIVNDLVAPAHGRTGAPAHGRTGAPVFAGGLLGHWAFWTRRAVQYHAACRRAVRARRIPASLLRLGQRVTEANAAIFDAANGFAGCIPGIHEILRAQGLLAGRWTLAGDMLSPGQRAAIDRVRRAYPELADDAFVAAHRDAWLR